MKSRKTNVCSSEKKDCRFNGWKNHSTWCVNLWITSSVSFSNRVQGIADGIVGKYYDGSDISCKGDLFFKANTACARCLEVIVESENPLIDKSNMYSDILQANLSEVYYPTITASFIDTAIENF